MEVTQAEADATLASMRVASDLFYKGAVRAGCHAFIEFTGLINEYISVCAGMSAKGDHSWVTANTHSERPLPIALHQAKYLAEKLDCIFGPSLRVSAELRNALFGK